MPMTKYLNKHSKSFTPRQRSTLEASEPPALAKMMPSAFFNSHWAANATENQSHSKNEWPHHHSAPILVQNNSGPNIHPSDAMGRTRCNHRKQCEQYGRQVHGQPLRATASFSGSHSTFELLHLKRSIPNHQGHEIGICM